MKFVKRISLFFIYPISMFSLGFASNMVLMEYFYPGRGNGNIQIKAAAEEGPEKDTGENTGGFMEGFTGESAKGLAEGASGQPKEGMVEVSLHDEPIVTANTQYVILKYNTATGETVEEEEAAPDKFMGLNRDKLVMEIQEYNQNPSLTDLEQDFSFMELVSFSPARVVVRKSYDPPVWDDGFFLVNENHYVVVYDRSLTNIFMDTDILLENLPESLQKEILSMKFVDDEKELYNFLESYSS
ncbi:MAG: hypothetical protein K2P25_04975 [Lachnospiraceae bacterium]|nr:hypothetical protein [Lachnospiraceae bacterium]